MRQAWRHVTIPAVWKPKKLKIICENITNLKCACYKNLKSTVQLSWNRNTVQKLRVRQPFFQEDSFARFKVQQVNRLAVILDVRIRDFRKPRDLAWISPDRENWQDAGGKTLPAKFPSSQLPSPFFPPSHTQKKHYPKKKYITQSAKSSRKFIVPAERSQAHRKAGRCCVPERAAARARAGSAA